MIYRSSGYAGGLIGTASQSTIVGCYSSVDVKSQGNSAGSLIGHSDGSLVQQCYAEGNVSGYQAGGLVGSILGNGKIENCYATGTVTSIPKSSGNAMVGGLVGQLYNTDIENSYATGRIIHASNTYKNGLVGNASLKYTVTHSYYDSTVSGFTTPPEQARTTEQMYRQATFEGWDFDNIWYIEEGQDYPKLRPLSFIPDPDPETNQLAVLLAVDETVRLSVSNTLSDNADCAWASDDDAIASVDANGVVTAHSEGLALITAAKEGFSESIYVRVLGELDELRLAVDLTVGGSARLYLSDSPDIVWTSFDPGIATVDANGRVTAVSKGLVIIQAEADGDTWLIYVRVRNA